MPQAVTQNSRCPSPARPSPATANARTTAHLAMLAVLLAIGGLQASTRPASAMSVVAGSGGPQSHAGAAVATDVRYRRWDRRYVGPRVYGNVYRPYYPYYRPYFRPYYYGSYYPYYTPYYYSGYPYYPYYRRRPGVYFSFGF